MEKVLITGGSGLIGKRLSELLLEKGYEVSWLSRQPKNRGSIKAYKWDVHASYIDIEAFHDLDHIIHLAGAGIADKRWSEKRKQEIIFSRVASTELLLDYVKKLKVDLKSFVSASATGYYGSVSNEKIYVETDTPGNDYLSEVCKLWEEAIFLFQANNIRTVALRTGIVLSENGGALAKMKTPIISPLGYGKQYMPWIHLDDLCKMYLISLSNSNFKGAYNAVAPESVNNETFSKILANTLKRPYLGIGVPAFLLQLVFGEIATILLNGSSVSADKIISSGFTFKFSTLQKALQDVV